MSELSSVSDNTLINISELSILFKDNYIDLINIDRKLYDNFTSINIACDIRLIGKLYDYYIWEKISDINILLIAYHNAPIKSWYKLKNIDDLYIFINYFNNILLPNNTNNTKNKLLNYSNQINLHINTSLSLKQIIKIIYCSDFIEKNLYQDINDIHTNRNKKLTIDEKLNKLEAISEKDTIYILTKYSKSLLELKNINNNIIISIKYNKINLRNRYDNIDKYIPSDVNIVLHDFNLLNYEDIINSKVLFQDLSQNTIIINKLNLCEYLLFNNKILYKKILIDYLQKNNDDNIINFINKKINEIEIDNIFNKIDKDGTFKAFENSLDILLKTLYEKLSLPETNYDINITYINNNIKSKIFNLLNNKLI